MGYDIKMDG